MDRPIVNAESKTARTSRRATNDAAAPTPEAPDIAQVGGTLDDALKLVRSTQDGARLLRLLRSRDIEIKVADIPSEGGEFRSGTSIVSIDPDFLHSRPLAESAGVLVHEATHAAFFHDGESRRLDRRQLPNIAGQLVEEVVAGTVQRQFLRDIGATEERPALDRFWDALAAPGSAYVKYYEGDAKQLAANRDRILDALYDQVPFMERITDLDPDVTKRSDEV